MTGSAIRCACAPQPILLPDQHCNRPRSERAQALRRRQRIETQRAARSQRINPYCRTPNCSSSGTSLCPSSAGQRDPVRASLKQLLHCECGLQFEPGHRSGHFQQQEKEKEGLKESHLLLTQLFRRLTPLKSVCLPKTGAVRSSGGSFFSWSKRHRPYQSLSRF